MIQALGTVSGIPETKALGKNQEPVRIMLPSFAFEDEKLSIPLKHLQEQLPNKFTITTMEQSAVCTPVLLPVMHSSRIASDFNGAFWREKIPQGNHVIILLFQPVNPGFKPPKAILAEKFYCSEQPQLLSATKQTEQMELLRVAGGSSHAVIEFHTVSSIDKDNPEKSRIMNSDNNIVALSDFTEALEKLKK
ncbi:hypothetical protein [Endozoicomonas atrinae]|uniref:hypothetical protein n=1 Tax=Endozoicomonas atrinae TaxID=1333660 RepID=UPI0008250D88|nr:hypothetical protein [Endozoicomonas atrinae]